MVGGEEAQNVVSEDRTERDKHQNHGESKEDAVTSKLTGETRLIHSDGVSHEGGEGVRRGNRNHVHHENEVHHHTLGSQDVDRNEGTDDGGELKAPPLNELEQQGRDGHLQVLSPPLEVFPAEGLKSLPLLHTLAPLQEEQAKYEGIDGEDEGVSESNTFRSPKRRSL